MAKLIMGVVAGAALLLAAEFLFLTRGGLPVPARNAKPLPLERYLTRQAIHRAMAEDAERPAPIPDDEPSLLAGAKLYRQHCAFCHGAPDEAERPAVARGMFPHPPRLMAPAKGVTDDPVGETYWIVKNGVRLTGMPGFEGALTDTQLWQVSLLLLRADRLPDGVKAALR